MSERIACCLHRRESARGGGHVRTSLSHEGFTRKPKARSSFGRAVPQGRAERQSTFRGPPPASVRSYPCPCINIPNLQSLAVLLSAQEKHVNAHLASQLTCAHLSLGTPFLPGFSMMFGRHWILLGGHHTTPKSTLGTLAPEFQNISY